MNRLTMIVRLAGAAAFIITCAATQMLRAQETTAQTAGIEAGVSPEGGRIVVEARGVQPKAPPFFAVEAETEITLGAAEIAGVTTLRVRILQGDPEVISLGLTGRGEVTDVETSEASLASWAVRQGSGEQAGQRFLDLRPVREKNQTVAKVKAMTLTVRMKIREPELPDTLDLPLLIRGDAVGFSSRVALKPGQGVDVRVTQATGMTPVGEAKAMQFSSTEGGRLTVALERRGAAPEDVEFTGISLAARLDPNGKSAGFRLQGQMRAPVAGARARLLSGRAALSDSGRDDAWHVELVRRGGDYVYEAVFDREGAYSLDVGFVAPVEEKGDWRTVDFSMPAGGVVPVTFEGWAEGVEFDPAAAVVPGKSGVGWTGFLPANGKARVSWKKARDEEEGSLFFTTTERSDVRVGAGVVRQTSKIGFRVLQGKLPAVSLRIQGPGEILGVEGSSVAGWKVIEAGGGRGLEVQLSRPMDGEGELVIRAQSALEKLPARAEPLRLTPGGAIRHSGFVRLANSGAVRIEIAGSEGMMQLAPSQFPGDSIEDGVRQNFVYRFPSADYDYRIVVDQILPEVSVSQILIYEITDADRVITAEIELDIREAPLRDWSLSIPADYAVVSAAGSEVADYVVETEARGGARLLKVLFKDNVSGRQLIRLRLEKNEPAAAGEWQLPPLRFPGARTVRGHVGVVSAPGYRILPGAFKDMAEVPLSFFPKQTTGLQQSFRLKEPGWTAAMKIEARGQTIQADVFHLYSLKEGVVYGSVLLNYFVVGAPATEWRIEVPESIGNIDVVGQNVRRDWRREGGELLVPLHQPVLGAATLLVTFEKPMSARGGLVTPGELRPSGVQSERGFIQVVSPLQVKHQILKAEGGLLKLEALELPTEYKLLSASPSLAVYQYTARPFEFAMNVEWYQPGEAVEQIIDFATLSSRVSGDGQVVTDALLFVKTRGRKALRMVLPEPLKLWEARVDGETVNARADEGRTLVPLPARLDPNQPVQVALRLGQAARSAGTPTVMAPSMQAPVVISEWTLRPDTGRLLVPKQATSQLSSAPLTESGFEWISTRGRVGTLALLALVAAAVVLGKARSGPMAGVGAFLIGLLAMGVALALAFQALEQRRVNRGTINYSASVAPAGDVVAITVGNVPVWRAMLSIWGVAALVAGGALLVAGLGRKKDAGARIRMGAGIAAMASGLLAQRGGAILFFCSLAALVLLGGLAPQVWGWLRRLRQPGALPQTDAGLTALFAGALGLVSLMAGAAQAEKAAPEQWLPENAKAAEAITQTWRIKEERLFGEIEFRVRGVPGDSFLLLMPPAVLTEFACEGLRIAKAERNGRTAYYVAPERAGLLTGRAKFEMPVDEVSMGIIIPTGPAAIQRISIDLDQDGWEFTAATAAQVVASAGLAEGHSGSMLVLGTGEAQRIEVRPRRRDIASEPTRFFAEVANLYVPGPGVVNGRHRVTVRPAQGLVSELAIDIPGEFTVGDVGNGPVGTWRFDPGARRLRVSVEPAQAEAFSFDIETQQGTSALPVEVVSKPVRVKDAAGEVSMIGLAFGSEAQPENVRPADLAPVNLGDFPGELLPGTKDGQTLATLLHVYRCGASGGQVEYRVAPVAPEVRVVTKQVLSIGDDRLVAAIELNVMITRAGVFKLTFALPDGFEVESLTGPALNHWTEAKEDGRRIVTMHLNGRTMGSQDFALALTGAAPPAQEGWIVPRLLLEEATRQTGVILLVPEKGIQLRAVERQNASQLDPRTAGGTQPGTLAFRLLEEKWRLKIGIETLDPWVTVQALEEITAREGQMLARIGLRCKIENAAVKRLRVRLPKLSEDQVRTVRATGQAVGEMVKVEGEEDLWEIQFRRGVAGETDIEIEYQGQRDNDNEKQSIEIPVFEGVRQVTQYVAVRAGGRLELDAGGLPRGWQRTDWSAAPKFLKKPGDQSVPAMCFKVAEPEGALTLAVKRHAVAEALKLRVTKAVLTSVLSLRGPQMTAAELDLGVVEKSTLQVWLPKGAELYNTFVNGESVSVVRDGDAHLFHVSPVSNDERSASVRFTYAVNNAKKADLSGPRLSVPLENVEWRVVIPPGNDLAGYRGGFRLREEKSAGLFGLKAYQEFVRSKRDHAAKKAEALLEQASALLQSGQQDKAGEALSRASKAGGLDEASNEDARVQLRALKEQQAVLGLNTRRQKMYLDNRAVVEDAVQNKQLEEAANMNPYLQGKSNFDPQQLDQLLMGNTSEENSALRGIAGRLVDQQLAAEPAPGAIDVTLPERGKVVAFTRSLQVDGSAPLVLNLGIKQSSRSDVGFCLLVLCAAGATGVAALRRTPRD